MVEFTAVVAGTIDAFDSVAYTENLASLVDVDEEMIALNVTPGSIHVIADIDVSQETDEATQAKLNETLLELHTLKVLHSLQSKIDVAELTLGVHVEGIDEPTQLGPQKRDEEEEAFFALVSRNLVSFLAGGLLVVGCFMGMLAWWQCSSKPSAPSTPSKRGRNTVPRISIDANGPPLSWTEGMRQGALEAVARQPPPPPLPREMSLHKIEQGVVRVVRQISRMGSRDDDEEQASLSQQLTSSSANNK